MKHEHNFTERTVWLLQPKVWMSQPNNLVKYRPTKDLVMATKVNA